MIISTSQNLHGLTLERLTSCTKLKVGQWPPPPCLCIRNPGPLIWLQQSRKRWKRLTASYLPWSSSGYTSFCLDVNGSNLRAGEPRSVEELLYEHYSPSHIPPFMFLATEISLPGMDPIPRRQFKSWLASLLAGHLLAGWLQAMYQPGSQQETGGTLKIGV